MGDGYTKRVADSILPLSVADRLPAAFREWSFTGNYYDHEIADQVCELCGQENIRYHFEIQNEHTQHKLDVGSHCILKFDVAVYDDGVRLSPEDAKRELHKLTQLMRLESCIRALDRLAKSEDNSILSGALDYYRKNKKLTPKQAFVVFWRLQENKIDHDPTFFRVSLRRIDHKNDLRNMPTGRVHRFWSALTPSQRKLAIEMEHKPPNKG